MMPLPEGGSTTITRILRTKKLSNPDARPSSLHAGEITTKPPAFGIAPQQFRVIGRLYNPGSIKKKARSLLQNATCQMSYVECHMYLSNHQTTQRPDDPIDLSVGRWVIWSFDRYI